MRRFILIISTICVILFLLFDYLSIRLSDYNNFYSMPILHDGRIKPLGVVANYNHKFISADNIDKPIEWFAKLLFNQTTFFEKTIFKIKNKEIITNLGVNDKNSFNLIEILDAFRKNKDLLNNLKKINRNNLSNSQKELLDLYYKTSLVIDLSNCMDLLAFNKEISKNFSNKITSKYKLILLEKSFNKSILFNEFCTNIKIIPLSDNYWLDLPEYLKFINFNENDELRLLESVYINYSNGQLKNWNIKLKEFNLLINSKLSYKAKFLIKVELLYSNLKLIYKSVYMFLICFVLMFFWKKNDIFCFFSKFFFLVAFLFQLLDIFFRIILTNKAPVTSLYESIIFVNCIFSFIFILFFFKKNFNNIFLFSSVFSFTLSFVAIKIGLDDDIKPLIAVLNTNLWLIVHVLTISVGYGLCLINGFFGHVYLFSLFNKNFYFKYKAFLYNIIFSFTLLALFFSFIGTLLGGIWADQSWGRFWGWDPKENGALLIVLWLTLILHARASNIISDFIFVLGSIFNIIVLLLAWFGVNLLNVGLHSYGFIEDIGKNLFIFIFIEILCIIFFSIYYKVIINYNNISDLNIRN